MAKILVIDDDNLLREMIVATLRQTGHEVFEAGDGKKGVELARAHDPDIVLCDIFMPHLDGYGTLRILREEPKTSSIPFIFLTGNANRETMRQGMDLGADDFLPKPFTIPELLKAIQTRLHKRDVLLRQAEKRLDDLRTSISFSLPHEIRTPLSGIIGFAEVLRDDCDSLTPKDIEEMAGMILKSATRLGHLVENFLTYAQLELLASDPDHRALLAHDSTTQLDSHVEEIARKKAEAAQRTEDLVLLLGGGEAAISNVNIRKILDELIDNAFKFSRQGSPVEITTQQEGNRCTITIADKGVGMSDEQIVEIGAYRQFGRQRREQQGAGLGLAIAKKIVEIHNGTVAIRSIEGQGTTVVLDLPLPLSS